MYVRFDPSTVSSDPQRSIALKIPTTLPRLRLRSYMFSIALSPTHYIIIIIISPIDLADQWTGVC